MSDFVLEIGTEELPARFLPDLERELVKRFASALAEAGYGDIRPEVSSTPRRAVVQIWQMPEIQPVRETLVSGPPSRVAFDAEGKPTKAAEGFARTLGTDVASLVRVQTEKGEHIAGTKKTGGIPTPDVLAELCPAIIAALPFPKRMRWGTGAFAYARPIRWILALFADAVIPFEVGGVRTDRLTYGHRVMGCGPFEVPAAGMYQAIIREKGMVEPQGERRRAFIVEQGNRAAIAMGGSVLWKESLLNEVQGLIEKPVPLVGDIDPAFLELPREVLLTSMESHQKSFGIQDAQGNLMPHFLTVLNLVPEDMAIVKKGWERVLRARLEDARFFWKTDLESSFDSWLASLDSVIFLAPLGSMGEKTQRVSALCTWIARQVGQDEGAAARAGRLSKADLVSSMVGEFDTLQGIMGGIYAREMGESEAVAMALTEQYLPAGPDTPVPAGELGSILSVADKVDTLVGCFGLGMIPTGAADPYALRRCALGIIRIMLERSYRFDILALFKEARKLYGERKWKLDALQADIRLAEFFAGRVRNYFLSHNYETPLVDAVTAVQPDRIWFSGQRMQALPALSRQPDFIQIVQTFKRVTNIIRKQGEEQQLTLNGQWDPALLEETAEKTLAQQLMTLAVVFEEHWQAEDAPALFMDLASVRPAIDTLFDSVMVMCEDPAVRQNRLNMLKAFANRMDQVADFAALQI